MHINICNLYVVWDFCAVSPVLKTSASAALSYSDIKVSILMHISYLNVMFWTNVSYVSQWPYIFLPHTIAHTIETGLYTYILLLSAAFTVLVLFVCECAALLNICRHTEIKYPLSGSYVSTSVRNMTSQISIFTAVLKKIMSCGIWLRVGCLNLQVLTFSILKFDELNSSNTLYLLTIYTESYPDRIQNKQYSS